MTVRLEFFQIANPKELGPSFDHCLTTGITLRNNTAKFSFQELRERNLFKSTLFLYRFVSLIHLLEFLLSGMLHFFSQMRY